MKKGLFMLCVFGMVVMFSAVHINAKTEDKVISLLEIMKEQLVVSMKSVAIQEELIDSKEGLHAFSQHTKNESINDIEEYQKTYLTSLVEVQDMLDVEQFTSYEKRKAETIRQEIDQEILTYLEEYVNE